MTTFHIGSFMKSESDAAPVEIIQRGMSNLALAKGVVATVSEKAYAHLRALGITPLVDTPNDPHFEYVVRYVFKDPSNGKTVNLLFVIQKEEN